MRGAIAAVAVLALAGCGRVGFEPAGGDGPAFVEPSGTLDPTFGSGGVAITSTPGITLEHFAVVSRAGGGYLAVGTHVQTSVSAQISLVAYTAAGERDPTYGSDGILTAGPTDNDYGYTAIRLAADRVLIGGDGDDEDGTGDDFTLGVIDENGGTDLAFGTMGFLRVDVGGGQRQDTVNTVAVGEAITVACGVTGYDLPSSAFALVGFDATGTRVPTWGTAGEVVEDFTSGADGCADATIAGDRLVAVGLAAGLVVAAYSAATGARDTTFAGDGTFTTTGTGLGVAIADGDVIAVGRRAGTGLVVRLAPDGTPRTGFGNAGEVAIPIGDLQRVLVQPDGKLVGIGNDGDDGVVVRLRSDGTLDPGFGDAGIARIVVGPGLALRGGLLDPDGAIVVVGHRTTDPAEGVIARLR